MAKKLDITVTHQLEIDDARVRVAALGEYFQNKHGVKVRWDGDEVFLYGRYLLLTLDGYLRVDDNSVSVAGRDPGMLLRKRATAYLEKKLRHYLDPGTPVESLARS